MSRITRILAGAIVVALALLPISGSAAAPSNAAHMSPMGELGCC